MTASPADRPALVGRYRISDHLASSAIDDVYKGFDPLIERLDMVFAMLGTQPNATDGPAIDGLIKEANATAGEIEDKVVLDAAIVANSQAVEHYEISRYGALIAWAEELGHDDVVRLLTTNLNEEKAANTKLNSVALRKGVNKKASAA